MGVPLRAHIRCWFAFGTEAFRCRNSSHSPMPNENLATPAWHVKCGQCRGAEGGLRVADGQAFCSAADFSPMRKMRLRVTARMVARERLLAKKGASQGGSPL